MNFFGEAQKVPKDCYAVITRTYADGREDHVLTAARSQWTVLDSNLVYITYPNIAAKEMCDTLSVGKPSAKFLNYEQIVTICLIWRRNCSTMPVYSEESENRL